MKIKTKKVITEKEYLHYVIDNTDFLTISHNFIHVNHDTVHSDIVLELHDQNNTTCANTWVNSEGETVFEVDIEEEITEDTVIPRLLTRNTSGGYNEWKDTSIKWFQSEYISAFYILNDDLTMTLIWRDGKLI